MTIWVKHSTAVTVKMGPFIDDTDGKTRETALSIARADIRVSKNGGAFAQSNNTAGGTHDENGYYGIPLDTTDTNTLGALRVAIPMTGALPVWETFMVVPSQVWDSFFGADRLQVHVDEMTAGIITAAVVATDAIDADALAADAVAEINATVDVAIADAALATAANLATVAGYVDTEVAAIKAKTDNLPSDPADASDIAASFGTVNSTLATIAGYLDTEIAAILEDTGTTLPAQIAALNNLSAAQVNAEVVDALVTDTHAEPASVPAATASLKDKIGWLAMLARNKVLTTGSAQVVRNDADDADIATATVADDATTLTRGKFT